MKKLIVIGCLAFMTACSQQAATDESVAVSPTVSPVAVKAYLSKEVAIDIAKRTEPSEQVHWLEPMLKDNERVDGDGKTLRTVWKVQGVYPAGNKIILAVDANNGKVWSVTEVEAQGAAQTASVYTGLHGLRMFDAQTGWLLAKSDVLRTENGGQTWEARKPLGLKTDGELGAAYMDARTAVVAAPLKGKLVVYRTSDSGRNWQQSTLELSGVDAGWNEFVPYVKSVDFIDSKQGWILLGLGMAMGSEEVAAYQTSDGGATWRMAAAGKLDQGKSNPIPLGGRKTGLAFVDARNGFLAGSDYGDSMYLYATRDGGGTWKRQTLALPKGLSAEGGASISYPPVFSSSKDGVLPVVFANKAAVFYVTHDGGASWAATTRVESGSAEKGLKWSVGSDKRIYVTDEQRLYVTKDGAKTWDSFKPSSDLSGVLELNFPDERSGFLVFPDRMLATTDGGHTWVALPVESSR